jgi:hypothetical protein
MSRASRDVLAQGIAEGITGAFQGYRAQQEENQIQSIVNNPNATPMQKALALSKRNPQLANQFLKNEQRQSNLQALNASVMSKLNPDMQGVGGPQMATRNAINPNQFMQGATIPQPGLGFDQNQLQAANAPVPQQNVPQPIDPIQELGRQEQIYKDAAIQYANADFPEQARHYESLAKSAQKERLDIQNSQRQQQQFHQKQLLPIQQDAEKTIKSSNIAKKALEDQLSVINETGQFSKANLSKFLRDRGYERLAAAAQSEGGAIFATAGKEIITAGLKNAFGARPLGIEFQAFDQMLAEVGRSPEVNKLAINSMLVPIQIENDIAKFKMNLINENPDISALQLNSEAYKYGEAITDQYLNAWKQQVRETMNRPKQGFFGSFFSKQNSSQNASKPSLEDIWK